MFGAPWGGRGLASYGDFLKQKHQALADHFSGLAGIRGNLPVFAIEHDLDEAALTELRATVALQLELDPNLRGANWSWSYLPLLVIATEVGYRYRGTGTDFWPVLSRDLGVEAGLNFRTEISRLFELGHRNFGLTRPGNSPWERHFPHIAWPIGNALVPLEIQPQLTDALRRSIRTGLSAEDEKSLLGHLKLLAAGHTSRRFENWLQQGEIAVEVLRRLLAPEVDGWLSRGVLQRIDTDIRRDLGSFRAISEARRISARRAARLTELSASRFVLSLTNGVPGQLLIRGPVLPAHLRDEVIAALRIQGDRIRAAGSDQSILLRSFLAGGELALGSIAALPNSPLRRSDASHSIQGMATTALEKLQPQGTTFFQIELGGHTAGAIFPKEVLGPDVTVLQWLRTDANDSTEFRRLDTSSRPDAELLRRNGFTILERKSLLRILGLPMPGSNLRFAARFPILARGDGKSVPLLNGAQPAMGSVRCRDVDWAVFQPIAGEHWLGPADGNDTDNIRFEVVDPPDVEPASISILPARATLADLEGGRMEIWIISPISLEALPICFRLMSAGQPDIIAEGIVERLPTRITGRSPLMQSLLSQLANWGANTRGVRLKVEVRGLLPASTHLRPVRRELRYDSASAQWISESDPDRIFPCLVATPQDPIPHVSSGDRTGFRLVLPDAPDHEGLGAGLVMSSSDILRLGRQEAETVELPTLLREAVSRDGRAGLVDIARATVAWHLAEASDPLSDWRRRSVVERLEGAAVELLCGNAWRTLETGIDLSILSQHGALLSCAQSLGLVSGEDLPRIDTASDRVFLRSRLLARLREVVPEISDAIAHWDEEQAGNLDLAVIEAYEDLRRHLENIGREAYEEVDMKRQAEDWRKALERAREMPLLPMFQRFILPEARWTGLMSPWYEELTEDDLVDLIDDCHVDASRRPGVRWLGRPELRTMLQFWLSPQAMTDAEEWSHLLGKGLSDVRTARAVRYVALRCKLARLDMPDGSGA